MQRITLLCSILIAAALLHWFVGNRGNAQNNAGGLPGARPTIDASAYPSLQSAFDALPAEGGLVRLPAGTFEIREPLRIKTEDVCIEGAGTATHIKNVNTDGKPALIIADADHKLEGNERGKSDMWRVRLADFRITGNEKSGHGIAAHNIDEIFIDGVTVSNHGGDGILLSYCYEDPRVCDSLITYNKGTGLNLQGCHDIVVSSNQFEENQDALHCFDGFNLCMTGNCLDDHLGAGVVIENTYGSVVSGNMIEECNGTAIILDRDCYGITLSSNVIAHDGAGIDLRDAHGCAVSANTFTIMKTNALRIGPKSGRITVGGNNFCNSYIGDNKVRRGTADMAAAGLVLDGPSDVAVSGNIFSGLTENAVSLSGKPQGILFATNLLSDVESDHGEIASGTVADNYVAPQGE
jgi:hypothetical protein